MRKWIVEETGEVRPPLNRENFLSATNKISLAYYNFSEIEVFPILHVTEITDTNKTPLTDKFEEEGW